MRYHILFLALFVGCSEASTDLTAWQKAMRDGSVDAIEATKAVEAKTDEAVVILKDNTAALARIEKSLEASLVESKSVRKEDDQQSAPEPPAKANTAATPVKVATPGAFHTASDGTILRWDIEGNWNPTILETSAHLAEHGIDTNGMTHQEMADIHAAIHEGKPVAMRSKAVAWSSFVNRGTNCPNGQCPQVSSRRRR